MVSELDEIGLRVEADILHHIGLAGVPLPIAEGMELWEIAALRGLHYTETLQEANVRQINEEQQVVWEETQETREAIMARAAERRRERRSNR
jgi:hypothetical protein